MESSTHLDVHGGYIPNDIVMVIDDRDRGDALIVHELEGVRKWFVAAALRLEN